MADINISTQRFTPPTLGNNPRARLVAQPTTVQEQLVVSGNPRASENRPDHARGRIPVAVATPTLPTETDEVPPFDLETIQHDVESSTEYQTLKQMGLIKESSLHTRPHHEVTESNSTNEIISTTGTPVLKVEQVLSAEISIEIEARLELRIETTEQATPVQQEQRPRRSDPLALDLNDNGLETSGIAYGVQFDINADGKLDQTSFISGGDAFLALDINGNGHIDNGHELFGDQNGDDNGYQALAHYDDNRDGIIDQNDAVFQQLRLFTQSRDGTQHLQTLEERGVASLSLSYQHSDIKLNQYDSVAQQSSFERIDGSLGKSGDLLLGYKSLS